MTLRRLLGKTYRGLATSRHSPLRPVAEALTFSRRMWMVRKHLRGLRGIREGESGDLSRLERIRGAWGNASWAADAGFLYEVASAVRSRPGPVLDCGSGLSTVICATLAARLGDTVWVLEQDRNWYEYMCRVIDKLHLDNVRLFWTPLRSYGDFAWFDLGTIVLPDHFSLVSCDGPAVVRSDPAWRVGVVIVLKNLDISFDEILLDDVEDPRCPALVERWQRDGISTTEIETATGKLLKGYAKTY